MRSLAVPLIVGLICASGCFHDPSDGSESVSSGTDGDGDGDPTGDGDGDPTGDGDPSGDGDGDPSGDGDGDPAGPCGAGMACASPAPAGWSGPVILTTSDQGAAECPPEFPSLVHDLHEGLSADPAECDCECSDPSVGITCTATLYQDDPGCNQVVFQPQQWQLDEGECQTLNVNTTAFRATPGTFSPNGSSCQPSGSANLPEPSWATSVAACGINNPDSCSLGGACMPETDAPLCIWVEGDTDCPSGPYEVQVVYHGDVDDQRECSECECGTPEGTCGGSVILQTNGCGIQYLGVGMLEVGGGCTEVGSGANRAKYNATHDGACPVSGGDPSGQVVPAAPVTFCCTQ